MVASCCPPSGPSLLCKTGSRGMVYQFLNRSMVSGFKIIVWELIAEPNNSRMLRPDTSAWANLHSPFLGNMKEKKWREEREGREGGKEGKRERKGEGRGEGGTTYMIYPLPTCPHATPFSALLTILQPHWPPLCHCPQCCVPPHLRHLHLLLSPALNTLPRISAWLVHCHLSCQKPHPLPGIPWSPSHRWLLHLVNIESVVPFCHCHTPLYSRGLLLFT